MQVVLAARDTQKLAALAAETGATCVACDATRADEVERLFAAIDAGGKRLDLVVYNASGRARGPIVDLNPAAVEQAVQVTAHGRISCCPAGGTPDARPGAWHDPLHRRQCKRQGVCAVVV